MPRGQVAKDDAEVDRGMSPCVREVTAMTTSPTQQSSESPNGDDSPKPFGHVKVLLDCFVLSCGPEGPQLGRNHPDSDPERYSTPPAGPLCVETSRRARAARRIAEVDLQIHRSLEGVFPFPDDFIVRELSEMRALLQRLLETREQGEAELRDILGLLPAALPPQEPTPHFPVGPRELAECGVCLQDQWLYRRPCCGYPVCGACLRTYFATRVGQGQVHIECCSLACRAYVHRDEVSARLEPAAKEHFHRLLARTNDKGSVKTCPRCSHVARGSHRQQGTVRITCSLCQLTWCYNCHAPWHIGISCKQYRKGDRLLKLWAKERSHGQVNAQKCPKCKIYIQRTSGCDHMFCTRCKTDFCYRCGDKLRRLRFFGDHYSKLSIFGCKYGYKADRPVQRKLIRGAVFGGKLMAVPLVGSFALCAGVLAVSLGVFLLPVYGGLLVYRRFQTDKSSRPHRHLPSAIRRLCGRYLE